MFRLCVLKRRGGTQQTNELLFDSFIRFSIFLILFSFRRLFQFHHYITVIIVNGNMCRPIRLCHSITAVQHNSKFSIQIKQFFFLISLWLSLEIGYCICCCSDMFCFDCCYYAHCTRMIYGRVREREQTRRETRERMRTKK